MKHVIVDKDEGRFFAWPANNGIWSWGNEIVVGYTNGEYVRTTDNHSVNAEVPTLSSLSRSKDGGVTWQREKPEGYSSFFYGFNRHTDAVDLKKEIDFSHPDLAIRCGGSWPDPTKAYGGNCFLVSYDRCHSWEGPYAFPDFGFSEELTSRTDYMVVGKQECLFFLAVHDPQVKISRFSPQDRAFCARTTDGGRTFSFVAWILPESKDMRSALPSTVRIDDKTLVSALRRRYDTEENDSIIKRCWIDVAVSENNGSSWKFLSKVADTDRPEDHRNGNPPALVRLPDDRLCCAYGFRITKGGGVRARISENNGRSWSDEIILRDDARTWDVGYPRMVVRPDGKLVTIYYFTTTANPEQHIAATIWDPDEV